MSHSKIHHPDGATLMSYAAATLCEPLAAVVACHVAMCATCRAEVADLERLGAALMVSTLKPQSGAPVEPRRWREEPPPPHRIADRDERLPAPLVAAYGLTFARIPWRRLGPGVWHHRLALRQSGEGDLRLMRIGAGRKMPEHGHGGAELTLVLEGSYSDVTGEYRRGDVQDVDGEIEHQPIVSNDGECICLIASEHPARFKSIIGRMMQPWTGL